ncbi:sensor domain-containing diguanylate cyclase [Janthinobacterium sp. 17J80-10]|uniref:GGDEF domain-containing protein n=1 Tax=Janthinobacterium sp. 17J80-10 TaxID=2497863 RepID=UPI0010054190|nr:sensor domain-containing diguanylate cyclase [Janthinobacterium sp. 17J80-10]QAU34762.1 sensor domain-containing diguanylate cyclase [Janthinobacterium sp. 17J80-10]
MASILETQISEMLAATAHARALSDVLDLFAKALATVPGIDGYWVNLLNASGDSLRCMKLRLTPEYRNLEENYLGHSVQLSDVQVNTRAFKSCSVIRITVENANDAERQILLYWKAQYLVAIPICDPDTPGQTPIGVLLLMGTVGGLLDDALQAARSLIDTFYLCLANWLRMSHLEALHQEAQSAVSANHRLLDFLEEMSSLTSVEKIYELFSAELFRQLKFDIAAYVALQGEQLVLEKIVGATPALQDTSDAWQAFQSQFPYEMDEASSCAIYVFMRNSHFLVHDLQQIMHLPMAKFDRRSLGFLERPRTLFLSAIRYHKQPVGVLGLYSLSEPLSLSENDLQLLEQLTAFLGTALTNSRLYATSQAQNAEIGRLNLQLQEKVSQLAELASTDQLTGLFNFRSFGQELERRLQEAARASDKKDLSLVVLDIDHFKSFNDRFGHAAGNDVLAAIARELNRHIRQTDMACRYGGEEFVVILPNCDLEGAQLLAERIRCGIEQICVSTCNGAHRITISAGCTVRRDGDTQLTLFGRADEALYQAKAQGRNRVCCG